jgi:hypothetical protein
MKGIDGNVGRTLEQLKRKMGQQDAIWDRGRYETAMRPGEKRRAKHSKMVKAQMKAEAD